MGGGPRSRHWTVDRLDSQKERKREKTYRKKELKDTCRMRKKEEKYVYMKKMKIREERQ